MKKTDELEQIAEMYVKNFGEEKTIWVLKDKEISGELKKLREESGATISQISKLIGMAEWKLANLENFFDSWTKDLIYSYLKALNSYKEMRDLISTK